MAGYIFVYFTEEDKGGEQVYFSISRDGLYWQDLNAGQPTLVSSIGDSGVRDPFLVKHPKTGMFYLMATDLCMKRRNHNWDGAVRHGSRDLIFWESSNLVNWSKPRAVTLAPIEAGCAWAPEAVWDDKKQAFLVFFACYTHDEGESKHRIYAVHTNDFVSFSPASKYIERERSVIDTTIIGEGDFYYRFSKDEVSAVIKVDRGNNLFGVFEQIPCSTLDGLLGLEGPECYRLPDGRWCLICDRFAARKGYLPIVIDDLAKGEMHVLEDSDFSFGNQLKRHGGVLEISDEDYIRLQNYYANLRS